MPTSLGNLLQCFTTLIIKKISSFFIPQKADVGRRKERRESSFPRLFFIRKYFGDFFVVKAILLSKQTGFYTDTVNMLVCACVYIYMCMFISVATYVRISHWLG